MDQWFLFRPGDVSRCLHAQYRLATYFPWQNGSYMKWHATNTLSPLYKKEGRLNKVNYRPVSLLTVISKIYESVMFDQVSDYFDPIFEDLLCAFRKKCSCQSTLIKAIDDWKVSLDHNEMVGTVFMDPSKAFDCLPHGLIIAKLHAYGLSINACDLFSSYLCNRFQRVKVLQQ